MEFFVVFLHCATNNFCSIIDSIGANMKNVLFVAKPNNKESLHLIVKIDSYLRSMGMNTFIEKKTDDIPNLQELDTETVDVCIAVGGDGTMMGAARDWGLKGIKLVGVNLGRVGFLTDIPAASCIEDIAKIIEGKFKEQTRSVLSINMHEPANTIRKFDAINDFVCRSNGGQLIEFTLLINGEFVYSQYCDGIIVSTPTGSTAYSVAAGGSIIQPQSKVWSIIPICPQNLSNRPLIVDDNSEIKIIYSSLGQFDCFYDGIKTSSVPNGTFFTLKKNETEIKILNNENYNYYNGLRQKLNWNKN